MSRVQSLIPEMIETAKSGKLNFRLSSTLLKGSKKLYSPNVNCDRRYCRGKVCPSLHAEAGMILKHFGKRLRYSDTYGWCLLREESKVSKV